MLGTDFWLHKRANPYIPSEDSPELDTSENNGWGTTSPDSRLILDKRRPYKTLYM